MANQAHFAGATTAPHTGAVISTQVVAPVRSSSRRCTGRLATSAFSIYPPQGVAGSGSGEAAHALAESTAALEATSTGGRAATAVRTNAPSKIGTRAGPGRLWLGANLLAIIGRSALHARG